MDTSPWLSPGGGRRKKTLSDKKELYRTCFKVCFFVCMAHTLDDRS